MVKSLQSLLGDALLRDEPLSRHTAARLGGPADWFYHASNSLEALIEVVTTAWDEELPVRILGSGANVLVSDQGVRGLVVVNDVSEVTFHDEPGFIATSGANLTVLARKCQSRGLAGFEWAVSVPGTVGGAVVNNAGAHGGDVAQTLREAVVLDAEKGLQHLTLKDLAYGYRYSSLKARPDRRFLVTRATFALQPDSPAKIQEHIDEFIAYRKRTQPPGASLGSIFKNPPGDYAGRLIESAGLKGYAVGNVQVSPIHANFFINTGNANASDYYTLIRHVRRTVNEKMNVLLELEIETIGEGFEGMTES